ncbi:28868_t:CDS:2, partial [Racocetra persica]
IDTNGKLFQKLICEGFIYTDRLSDYLEDIGGGKFELDPLTDFYHPALILPLSILANRSDICKKFPISVEFAIEEIIWEHKETKVWRKDILTKFLYHPNLTSSKYRPGALYNAFIK